MFVVFISFLLVKAVKIHVCCVYKFSIGQGSEDTCLLCLYRNEHLEGILTNQGSKGSK